MTVRVYKILKNTKVEGPGIRYCIWFQGCKRHCKGCWAKETWDFNGGNVFILDELLKDILNTKNIEGVTFLGGEPFDQPQALNFLAKNIKEAGFSVLCFTGYKIENLNKTYKDILNNIDLLIDGEFIEEEIDYSRPWVGSKNQRYHFLTNRYNESIIEKYKNKVEININKNGSLFINGMGDFNKLSQKLGLIFKH